MLIIKKMKKIYLIINLSILFVWILSVAPVFAQDKPQELTPYTVKQLTPQEWKRTVSDIKAQTKELLAQYDQLLNEYNFLCDEMAVVQKSLSSLKQEIRDQKVENKRLRARRKDEYYYTDTYHDERRSLEQKIASLEDGNIELREKLEVIEKENESLQGRLSGLRDQKRELILDIKLHKFVQTEELEAESEEIQSLQRDLALHEEKERKLSEIRDELDERLKAMPYGIEKIRQENLQLASHIDQLKAQKKDLEREIPALVKENQRLEDDLNRMPPELLKEKAGLEKEVVKLEKQLEGIRQEIEQSAEVLERKKQIMDEIKALDEQNRELRTQVTDLMGQIDSVEQEIQSMQPDQPAADQPAADQPAVDAPAADAKPQA